MNKLKMLVLTALAAATVGVGALAAAPSASAMPPTDCKVYLQLAKKYWEVWHLLQVTGYGQTEVARQVLLKYHDASAKWNAC